MAALFHLEIVSIDGKEFEGEVQSVSCRAIDGDLTILARHMNFCTAIGMGLAKVVMDDGSVRQAACIGGMLSVIDGECHMIVTTWEWREEIDVDRAENAKKRAESRLADKTLSEKEQKLAEAKLHRALVRLSVAGK